MLLQLRQRHSAIMWVTLVYQVYAGVDLLNGGHRSSDGKHDLSRRRFKQPIFRYTQYIATPRRKARDVGVSTLSAVFMLKLRTGNITGLRHLYDQFWLQNAYYVQPPFNLHWVSGPTYNFSSDVNSLKTPDSTVVILFDQRFLGLVIEHGSTTVRE